MTEQEVRNALREVIPARRLIEQHTREVERLRSMAQSVSASPLTGMPHGGSDQDKLGAVVARICDLADDVEKYVRHYEDKLHRAYQLIELAEDIDGKAIITARHINGKSWDFIPYIVNMSRSTVFYHYNLAIRQIAAATEKTKVRTNSD